jgi:hypothetical protein
MLTRLQQILFGFGPDAYTEQFVGTLYDLQWLSKIMAGHGKESGLKVDGLLWICPTSHTQDGWLLSCLHNACAPGVGNYREPFFCSGHGVLSSSQRL